MFVITIRKVDSVLSEILALESISDKKQYTFRTLTHASDVLGRYFYYRAKKEREQRGQHVPFSEDILSSITKKVYLHFLQQHTIDIEGFWLFRIQEERQKLQKQSHYSHGSYSPFYFKQLMNTHPKQKGMHTLIFKENNIHLFFNSRLLHSPSPHQSAEEMEDEMLSFLVMTHPEKVTVMDPEKKASDHFVQWMISLFERNVWFHDPSQLC